MNKYVEKWETNNKKHLKKYGKKRKYKIKKYLS